MRQAETHMTVRLMRVGMLAWRPCRVCVVLTCRAGLARGFTFSLGGKGGCVRNHCVGIKGPGAHAWREGGG